MDFLTEILGPHGVEALNKAAEKMPALRSVIVPRAIIAWLSTMSNHGFQGSLPGTESYIALVKTENDDFTGAVTIGDKLYEFNNSNLLHVAASVGVALGIDSTPISEQLKKTDLIKLGKSIDSLVKSNIIKKARVELDKRAIRGTLGVTKHEANKECDECGLPFFKNDQFVGCLCIGELSKNIKTNVVEDGYILDLSKVDEDTLGLITEALK